MKLQIAWIGKTKEVAIRALTDEYLKRISRYVGAESHEMNSEPALLDLAADTTGRTAPVLIPWRRGPDPLLRQDDAGA